MTLFSVQPHQYDLPFPHYSEPKELGGFSLDENRSYCHDKRQQKYLRLPKKLDEIKFDLNIAYELAIKKKFGLCENLDNLLKWILSSKDELQKLKTGKSNNSFADFVCYRGLLATLLCTPYEDREGWIICATKFQNVIYLCQFDTPEKKLREANMTERDRLMCSWGYKFEQYLSVDKPDAKPDPSTPVNELEEFCSVVRTRLDSFSLLFGAEMDCLDPKQMEKTSMSRYYELKTSRHITSSRQDRNFKRFKLLKWWAQSFLIGIEQIICGFRDDTGIVHALETFSLKEIPKQVMGLWKPNVCMNFCVKFLHFLQNTVEADDPKIVYKFDWNPGLPVKCEVFTKPSEYHFLPHWFVDDITQKDV